MQFLGLLHQQVHQDHVCYCRSWNCLEVPSITTCSPWQASWQAQLWGEGPRNARPLALLTLECDTCVCTLSARQLRQPRVTYVPSQLHFNSCWCVCFFFSCCCCYLQPVCFREEGKAAQQEQQQQVQSQSVEQKVESHVKHTGKQGGCQGQCLLCHGLQGP